MSRLYLLRHADALAQSPDGDLARQLSPRGRRDAARLGLWLRMQNVQLDAVLVSPSRRTRETVALALAEVSGRPEPKFLADLYDASAETLARAIADANATAVLVIAHNPGIAELACALGARAGEAALEALSDGFPPCALAIFETRVGFIHLIDYMTPENIDLAGLP